MYVIKVWSFVLCFVAIFFNCFHSLSVSYKFFKAIYGNNVKSAEPISKVLTDCSPHMCYMTCGSDESCKGYNYRSEERTCELLLSPCQPLQQLTDQGSIYMERLDRRFCQNQTVCYVYGYGTWDDGMRFCKAVHPAARLIEEHSYEEAVIHAKESDAAGYMRYWLAGKRPPNGGRYEFYWQSSGDNITYSRWHDDQPYEGSADSDCIMASKQFDYQWQDDPCSNNAMYMCEIDYTKIE